MKIKTINSFYIFSEMRNNIKKISLAIILISTILQISIVEAKQYRTHRDGCWNESLNNCLVKDNSMFFTTWESSTNGGNSWVSITDNLDYPIGFDTVIVRHILTINTSPGISAAACGYMRVENGGTVRYPNGTRCELRIFKKLEVFAGGELKATKLPSYNGQNLTGASTTSQSLFVRGDFIVHPADGSLAEGKVSFYNPLDSTDNRGDILIQAHFNGVPNQKLILNSESIFANNVTVDFASGTSGRIIKAEGQINSTQYVFNNGIIEREANKTFDLNVLTVNTSQSFIHNNGILSGVKDITSFNFKGIHNLSPRAGNVQIPNLKFENSQFVLNPFSFSIRNAVCNNTKTISFKELTNTNQSCGNASSKLYQITDTDNGSCTNNLVSFESITLPLNFDDFTLVSDTSKIKIHLYTLVNNSISYSTLLPVTVNNNNITATVPNINRANTTYYATIIYEENAQSTITLTNGTNSICSGDQVTASITPVNSNYTYKWYLNGNVTGTNSATYTSSTITDGQLLTCTILTNDACNTLISSNSIQFNVDNNCNTVDCENEQTLGTCAIPFQRPTTNITSISARLNWSAVTSDVSLYILEYRVVGSTNWLNIGTVNHPSTSSILYGLTGSTLYEWRIKSKCISCGSSNWRQSTAARFTTSPGTLNCNRPTARPPYNITNDGISFRWANTANTLNYNFQYRALGSQTWITLAVPNPGSTITQVKYRVNGLIAGTTYQWQVSSNCTSGGSTTFTTGPNVNTLSGARFGQPSIEEYMEEVESFDDAKELAMKILVYPNPATDFVNIQLNSVQKESIIVTLNDLIGKEIQQISTDITEGVNTISLKTDNIPSGMYIVTLKTENSLEKIKVFKK